MKKRVVAIILLLMGMLLSGCPDTVSQSSGVYMLLDTSGTYKNELNKACAIIHYLLGTLEPGDSLAVARIDTASFSEKDIVKKVTFDKRPSMSNGQKRIFRDQIDNFISSAKGSPYTDITGGILQAAEYLNETGAGKKHVLIFSDLKEELAKGYVRDMPIQMTDLTWLR